MVGPRIRVLAVGSAAVLLAACGSGGHSTSSAARSGKQRTSAAGAGRAPGGAGPTTTIPAPPATGTAAAPSAVRVIKAWSDALRSGDVRRAAGYFAVPSEMINGAGSGGQVSIIRIYTPEQALVANETLPCGAKFLSADMRGRFVNVLFRLTGRPGPGGSACGSAPGETARTNFVIARGRIVEWIRAPDEPGDNGSPATPAPTTPAPPNSGPVA